MFITKNLEFWADYANQYIAKRMQDASKWTIHLGPNVTHNLLYFTPNNIHNEGRCSIITIPEDDDTLKLSEALQEGNILSARIATTYLHLWREKPNQLLLSQLTRAAHIFPASSVIWLLNPLQNSFMFTVAQQLLLCPFCSQPLQRVEHFATSLRKLWTPDNKVIWVHNEIQTTPDLKYDLNKCKSYPWGNNFPDYIKSRCFKNLILFQTVAAYYNLTPALRYTRDIRILKANQIYRSSHGDVNFFRDSASIMQGGLTFDREGGQNLYHVSNKYVNINGFSEVMEWVCLFDGWTVALILGCMVFTGLVSLPWFTNEGSTLVLNFLNAVSHYARELVRQPSPLGGHYTVKLVSLSFVFILMFYENSLTSQVLAPRREIVFKDALDFIKNGYKIHQPLPEEYVEGRVTGTFLKRWSVQNLKVKKIIPKYDFNNILTMAESKYLQYGMMYIISKAITEKQGILEVSQNNGVGRIIREYLPLKKCTVVDVFSPRFYFD